MIAHARRSLFPCVVIFHWGCNYQKINKFTSLRQDAVRIHFGSRSTWLVSISEGDRNLADLARQWGGLRRPGGACESESQCRLGFHPALAAPVAQISFTQQIPLWWETEGRWGGAEHSLNKNMAEAPAVLILILIKWLGQMRRFFWKWELWLCITRLPTESRQKINIFNHARELFCQSRWVRWLQLSLKTMKNFAGLPQAPSASSQGL